MRKTKAFVLRYTPFRESDRIVNLFTEESGLLTGIARGSLKMKSKITGALEPYTLAELRYVAPHGRDMVIITGCDPISSLFAGFDDLQRAAAACVICELTMAFNAEHDPNLDFFRLLAVCHNALKSGRNPDLVLRYFELFTIRFAGYMPPVESIKTARLRGLISYLSRTHISEAEVERVDDIPLLGRYLRRIIRHSLDRPLRSYAVVQRLNRSLGSATVKRP